MYADYFGLREPPFSIAPNPRFLYMSHAHQEALAHLLYGLDRTGGFIVLTGEVGTGKTTLSRRALENAPIDVRIAFIITPNLAPEQLLESICEELEIDYEDGESRRKLTNRIQHDLIHHHGEGKRTVLIIDEAQNMEPETLEQIRMLTNLETNEEKLMRIILIGQPELNQLLQQEDMRQLRQRVTGAYHLIQLTESDTRSYIESRLNTAGASRPIFTPAAFNKAYRLSKGIPRIINVLCDRAMLGAFSHSAPLVTPKHLQRAYNELATLREPKAQSTRWRWMGLVLLPIIAAIAYFWLNRPLLFGHSAPIQNDTISSADFVSISDAFGVLSLDISGKSAANCSQLQTHNFRCAAYKEADYDTITKIAPPFIIEMNTGSANSYWLVRSINNDGITLDNTRKLFRLDRERFSELWSGSLLVVNQ